MALSKDDGGKGQTRGGASATMQKQQVMSGRKMKLTSMRINACGAKDKS
jgi:hypothetical protein